MHYAIFILNEVGTLDAVLTAQGYQLQYLDPTIDNLDNTTVQHADLLIVLGGPIGAYDEQIYPFLEQELSIVRQRLDSRKPPVGHLSWIPINCQGVRCQGLSARRQRNRLCTIDTNGTLTAPASGTIALVQADVGQVVAAGTPVLRPARGGEHEIEVNVPESRIGQMANGQTAKVRLLSLPDAEITARVREIASVADAHKPARIACVCPCQNCPPPRGWG